MLNNSFPEELTLQKFMKEKKKEDNLFYWFPSLKTFQNICEILTL